MSGSGIPTLPGVKVGPLDPDRTADFGQVSGSTNARTLIRLHAQMYPQHLVRALALKQDVQRTLGLDMDEVRDYLGGLELENGDPMIPDGVEVVGAAVRGERDRDQILTFTFEMKGRTGKWFAPYSADVLPISFDDGSERVHLQELRDRGLVPTSSDGPRPSARAAAGTSKADAKLERENEKLRNELEAERKRWEAELAEARAAADEDAKPAEDDEPTEPTSSEEPPFDGYDGLNAAELVKRVKSEDTSEEEVQAILDFEGTHANRRSVVGAAQSRLGSKGRAE